MNLSEHVRDYCERQGAALDAEPLNALSNLAFFYFAWKLWQEIDPRDSRLAAPQRWLAVLIALVGFGSLAFHTFATVWAGILDVVFIAAFNVSYLVIFLRLVAGWSAGWALAAGAGFVLVDRSAAIAIPGHAFNGSGVYLPALVALIVLTAYACAVVPRAGRMMVGAAALFAISLAARSVDQALCASWPWGTHFAWHLLNAWVLYRLSRALAVGAKRDRERT